VDRFLPDAARGPVTIWQRGRLLRKERFDWAVLLPDSARAALAPFLAGIQTRVGYARDLGRRILLTEALDPPSKDGKRLPIPMTERYLAITRRLGCTVDAEPVALPVDAEAAARVEQRLTELGLSDKRFVVVTPGANFGSSKLYPPEHFAAACDGLSERLGLTTVLAPGPGEEALARTVAEHMSAEAVVIADPVTSLTELVALIARCELAFSNDTGPRHIAVATDRPVVVVIGPTDSRHTDYQLERQRVLSEDVDCRPCHLKTCPIDHRCMTRLAPERVVAAAEELLS
jgi:heptosyltransferase-2